MNLIQSSSPVPVAAVVQALLDNLLGRGLDPAVCRLFIIDGAKALSKAIHNTFGTLVQV